MTGRHGHSPRYPKSPTYQSWSHMKDRCQNTRSKFYPIYGGRGIVVCERWRTHFRAFLEDMGPRPPGTTPDRIDVNGNYEPANCRWATIEQQNGNRRPRVLHKDPATLAKKNARHNEKRRRDGNV